MKRRIERMEFRLRPHPSGHAIRRNDETARGQWRVPDHGFVTPRLRPENRTTVAIGFTARLSADEGFEE